MIAPALALTAALALGQHAPQKMASEMLPPEQEAVVHRIGDQLRCAVCQGLSIAASPSSIARAQLDTVRDMVRQGKSEQEIKDYFVERYGEWVLLSPRAEGINWLVWLGPGALLIAGGFTIARTLRGPKAKAQAPAAAIAPAAPAAPATPAAPVEDEYLRRVREEVEG